MNLFRLLPLAALVFAATSATPARADTVACTSIASLPTTLSVQGVYCLKASRQVAGAPVAAIDITANNVILDCNGYELRSTGTATFGILAANQQNITIRNCVVTGFQTGIETSGSGHLVEDNSVMRSRNIGIKSSFGPSVVRRNFVFRTGGVTGASYPVAFDVSGSVDVLDNTVAGVAPLAGSFQVGRGIAIINNPDGEVAGNHIWGLTGDGGSMPAGIAVAASPGLSVHDNDVLAKDGGHGVSCNSVGDAAVFGNFLAGFITPVFNCLNGGNHLPN